MANRYGRNQKRKHREEIERLSAEAKRLTAHLSAEAGRRLQAEESARLARIKAIEEISNHSARILEIQKIMAHELGEALGKELRPHAEKLMKALRSEPGRQWSIGFTGREYVDVKDAVLVLRGSIPSQHYEMMVLP